MPGILIVTRVSLLLEAGKKKKKKKPNKPQNFLGDSDVQLEWRTDVDRSLSLGWMVLNKTIMIVTLRVAIY